MQSELGKSKKEESKEASMGSIAQQPSASAMSQPRKGTFRLEDVKANAEAAEPVEKNKALAYGAYKYAEVIAQNFPDAEIDYMAYPRDLDENANDKALPIHFLFKENGVPKVAVVIVTAQGYRTPRVVATRLWCQTNGITYIRMHADGTYADWITGASTGAFNTREELEAFCKSWVVDTIKDALK